MIPTFGYGAVAGAVPTFGYGEGAAVAPPSGPAGRVLHAANRVGTLNSVERPTVLTAREP